MGNENVIKDPNIEIFLQLKKLIYHPGDQVKGCVYLEAKQYAQYGELVLCIQCFQKTQYKQKKDKHNQTLLEQRRTYLEQLRMAKLINGLYQGQHQFPFSLRLPSQLPGSLLLGPNDYIRYRLTAFIQSTSPQKTNQLHQRQIWIIQKFRSPIEPIFCQELKQPKCCMFGYTWGWIKTQIECETNCIHPGQKIRLKFEINTHRMNSKVKQAKIRILQKNITVTHDLSQQKQAYQLFAFDFNQTAIQKGDIKKMEKYVLFPLDLSPTSIGQLLARFYVIQVHLLFSCYSELKQQLHIFVSSDKNGLKEENKPFNRPRNWKPQKYQKLEFNSLKKFQFKPHAKIPFHNQLKIESNKLEAMKTAQPESDRRISG